MTTTNKEEAVKDRAVLVTTEHRGVFFGYVGGEQPDARTVTLTRCRNCIYWAATMGGFLGLASIGPDADCKIGTEAPEVTLYNVTSISDVTPEAAEKWAAA